MHLSGIVLLSTNNIENSHFYESSPPSPHQKNSKRPHFRLTNLFLTSKVETPQSLVKMVSKNRSTVLY